jgi:hypothetical protein
MLAHPSRACPPRLDPGTQFSGLVEFAQEQCATVPALCLAVAFFLVSPVFVAVGHGVSPL